MRHHVGTYTKMKISKIYRNKTFKSYIHNPTLKMAFQRKIINNTQLRYIYIYIYI
jgi:hypothetical protein